MRPVSDEELKVNVRHAYDESNRQGGVERVAIDRLFPPYTKEKNEALTLWFEY